MVVAICSVVGVSVQASEFDGLAQGRAGQARWR